MARSRNSIAASNGLSSLNSRATADVAGGGTGVKLKKIWIVSARGAASPARSTKPDGSTESIRAGGRMVVDRSRPARDTPALKEGCIALLRCILDSVESDNSDRRGKNRKSSVSGNPLVSLVKLGLSPR